MRHPFDPSGRPDPSRGLREHLRAAHDEFHESHFPPEGGGFPPHPGQAFGGGFPPQPPGRGGFGPGFGPGFAFGFGRGGGRGRGHGPGRGGHGPGRGRARRGNVRAAVLMLLTERPMHGYEIIQEISERSRGWWRPSPGSVYPTLQLLADEGLVTTDPDNPSGKRLYSLTEAGTEEAGKQDATPPWEQAADDVDATDVALREAMSTLMGAAGQLSTAGSAELRAKAAKILVETRRQLYLLLADAGTEQEDGPVTDAVPEQD
ncbi:MAG TPA: PadR family transcriptional regulator [Pseudonocardiaceae bacterium]|nr:PadR family transcriptional regulator [Pseudonocardiaceae bacterium]